MPKFALPAALITALALTGTAMAGPNDPAPVPDKKAQIQSQMGPNQPAASPVTNVLKPRKAVKMKTKSKFFAKASKRDVTGSVKLKAKAKAK